MAEKPPMTDKERRKLERELKVARQKLDVQIQHLNGKFNSNFFNPDKHLVYQGVLRVTFTRNFVDNTKSLVCASNQPGEKIIPSLIDKFMITENAHMYSLWDIADDGTERIMPDSECPLKTTLEWGDEYGSRKICIRIDPHKVSKVVEIKEVEEEEDDEPESMEDYGYQKFLIDLSIDLMKVKELSKTSNQLADSMIKVAEDTDQLTVVSSQAVLKWGGLIKQLMGKVNDMTPNLDGVLAKQVELFNTAITKVFAGLVGKFKEFRVSPSRDAASDLISKVRELKAYGGMTSDMVTGVLSVNFLIDNTSFVVSVATNKNKKLCGSQELCPLFLHYIARASLIPVATANLVDKSAYGEAVDRFLKAPKKLSDTLTTCADYVLLSSDESLKQDEKTFDLALQEARMAARRASGFWPPPGTVEAFMIAIQKVVLAAATYIFQAKRCKILRNSKMDVTDIFEEKFMSDLEKMQEDLEKQLVPDVAGRDLKSKAARLPLLQLSTDRQELKRGYTINLSVQKTVKHLCSEVSQFKTVVEQCLSDPEYDEDEVASGRLSEDFCAHVTELVREICDSCSSIREEVETVELPKVAESVQQELFKAKRPIQREIRDVQLACLIATGFWPPPQSSDRLIKQVQILVNDTLIIDSALNGVLGEQKNLYEDTISWEEEQREWQERACSSDLRILARQEGLPKDKFEELLAGEELPSLLFEPAAEGEVKKVKGATLDELIKHLTYHGTLDSERISFSNIFLLTFHSFTTAIQFMDRLIVRYSMASPNGLSSGQLEIWNNSIAVPTRIRIYAVLKAWMNSSFDDFFNDSQLVARFYNFTELMKKDMPTATDKIMATMKNYLTYGAEKSQSTAQSGSTPKAIMPKHVDAKMTLLMIDPLEIARQLTLIDFEIYKKIRPSETYGLSWNVKERQHLAKNIIGLINRANDVSLWVATEIVRHEKLQTRINVLKHFISVAEKCVELNNFNAMFSFVAAGLSAGCVSRLAKTWEGLPSRSKEIHEQLCVLIKDDQSYRNYRQKLQGIIDKPCIPFLGIYLTDLTFIEEGNPDFLDKPKTTINFSKRRIYSNTINQMLKHQKISYNLQMINPINKFLTSFEMPWNEDELYDQSRLVEPKEE